MTRYILIALVMDLALPARADVQEFLDKAWWETTAAEFSAIPFTEYYPPSQIITDQYEELGVLFTGSTSTHFTFGAKIFQDGVGLAVSAPFPQNASISLVFAQPMLSIGADHMGPFQIRLFTGSTLIFTSTYVNPPGQEYGAFLGVVSDQPFDRALLIRLSGGVTIDNLYFGSASPARGACCLVDNTCQNDMLEFSCLAQRGIYQGDGSTCETICPPICQGDIDGDGSVDIDDLLVVVNHWGGCPYPCPLPCPGDIIPNCWVNIDDLLMIVNTWGQCQ